MTYDYKQHGSRHHPLYGSDPILGLGFPRISWGRMLDDGTTLDAGTDDWSAQPDTAGIVITFDPAWATRPSLVACCSDDDDPYAPTDVVPPSPPGISATVTFLRVDIYDLSTIILIPYDMDGNMTFPSCGFSFIAVGA